MGGASFGGDGFCTGGPGLLSGGDGAAPSGGLNEEALGLKLKEAAAGFILKDGLSSEGGVGEALSAWSSQESPIAKRAVKSCLNNAVAAGSSVCKVQPAPALYLPLVQIRRNKNTRTHVKE